MRYSLARSALAFLLAFHLLTLPIFSQQDLGRPRTVTPKPVSPRPPSPQPAENSSPEWKVDNSHPISEQPTKVATSLQPEPTIRVALATNVRSATISSTGRLLNGNDEGENFAPLEVTRLRLEPRLLSPPAAIDTTDASRIQLAGLASREDAEQKAKDVREAIAEDSQVVFDDATRTWGLLIGTARPAVEAEELRARLEDAGFDATVTSSAQSTPRTTANNSAAIGIARYPLVEKTTAPTNSTTARVARPAARFSSPTREVVALAPGAGRYL